MTMTAVHAEQVLVVPTSLLHRLGYFQGFSADVDRYFGELFSPEHTSYRPRGQMETDPSFKQLIPYVIFRYTDVLGIEHVFQYRRGKGQGERRLHAKRSVGVGGHICLADAGEIGDSDPYEEGLRRELDEEVEVRTGHTLRCIGLINDDETDVGRVHLGVVHICDCDAPDVEPREADIIEAGFRPVSELLADLDGFESWSQICLSAIFGRQ